MIFTSLLILLTGCGGVKVSEFNEDIGYDFSDSTVGKLNFDLPKDLHIIEVNYKSEINGVEITIDKVHFAKGLIGVSLSFQNKSKDNTYTIAAATRAIRVNSKTSLGPRDLSYIDYDKSYRKLAHEGDAFESLTYWSLEDVDYKNIKEIDLQVTIFDDSGSSDESLINFKRKITF
ncbi:hypothetical protein [Bacillus sp. UNC125MFCrub1.1]|uniref:hypothetical protein n=1 Tax=Bacillus sp. UNC125MFCrub1.1 TaxID=1380371 RepID=UPI0005522E37|nr:hypothetical protein [Bacillus sp. UNC125MFCrub1.1]